MSFEAFTWAIQQDVFSSTRKFVLAILGNFAGDTGLSYPSVATISQATALTEETVRKALDGLEADGFIKDTGKRAGATNRIKVYQLPEDAWSKASRLAPRPRNTPKNRGINPEQEIPPKTGVLDGGESPRNPQGIPKESPNSSCVPYIKELELEHEVCGASAPTPAKADHGKPSSLEACEAYATEIDLPKEEAAAFFDHFTSNGWKVGGRTPMKDWKAAMRTWKRNQKQFRPYANSKPIIRKFDRNAGTANAGLAQEYA